MTDKHRIPKILVAMLLATSALLLSYISTNLNVAVSGEKTVLKYWCALTDWLTSGREDEPVDDVVFINVSYDKELVERNDMFGLPVGNTAVTDRGKLLKILQMIDSTAYRYVMLDVFFEEGYATDVDSCLFSQIDRMDRVVIPMHADGVLADIKLEAKAAYSDYANSINETDFTKYDLFRDNGPSIPLKVYTDLTGHSIKRKWFWYADGGDLARKVIFPKMYIRADAPYRSNGEKSFLNMGADILTYADDIDWQEFFRDKYVVIGAFSEDDIHATYAGNVPGCLINYNVFLALLRGKHTVPLTLLSGYFLLFFVMSYLLLGGRTRGTQVWTWVCARLFVVYSAVLTLVCISVFAICGQAQDIFITSTFFSAVDVVNRVIKSKTKNHA